MAQQEGEAPCCLCTSLYRLLSSCQVETWILDSGYSSSRCPGPSEGQSTRSGEQNGLPAGWATWS